MWGLNSDETALLKTLDTPQKIQDYLDALPINHEKEGETCYSPRLVMRHQKAHCLEGALFGCVALKLHGYPAAIVDMETLEEDEPHAIALFRVNGLWGALSKTNHAILRWRDPIYRSVRELVLSYFHEYFLYDGGIKTLRAYSKPINPFRYGTAWVTAENSVWNIAEALRDAPHLPCVPKKQLAQIRPASQFERTIVETEEWSEDDPRT